MGEIVCGMGKEQALSSGLPCVVTAASVVVGGGQDRGALSRDAGYTHTVPDHGCMGAWGSARRDRRDSSHPRVRVLSACLSPPGLFVL